MEYSMISNMLGPSVSTPATDASSDSFMFPSPTAFHHPTPPALVPTLSNSEPTQSIDPQWANMSMTRLPNQHHSHNHITPGSFASPTPSERSPVVPQPLQILSQQAAFTDPHGQRPTPVARRPFSATNRVDPQNIYKTITKPFCYTTGYHLLNTYIRNRFNRDDLLRIARAIVGYRPSFIALTKTLKEEDLTFMEVCFQRTLLEYEKFIGYSGTPTVIWRRTGQIELVGKEFCLLTQWTREQLLSRQTFVAEVARDAITIDKQLTT